MKGRTLAAGATLALAGIVAAGSIVRISPQEAGASRGRWISGPWSVRRPFAAVTRVPRAGSIEIGPLQGRSPEGAARAIALSVQYSLRRDGPATELASAVSEHGALAPALAAELSPVFEQTLRASGGTLPRHGSAGDSIGSALAARLVQLGVIDAADSRLTWTRTDAAMGPPVAALAPPHRRKILLIGLDAADWQIIDPLIAKGQLPNLARLIEAGARGPLRSYDPMISPLIWTTMATGVGPDVHGIADFLVSDTATGGTIPITSRFRRVKALWNILTEARLRSGFIGWWASYPAEPVDGLLVTDLMGFSLVRPDSGAAGSKTGITYPESYYAEIRPRMILPDQVGYEDAVRFIKASREEYQNSLSFKPQSHPLPGRPPQAQDPVWLVRRAVAMTRNYETIALDLLSKDLDVVGVYFEGIDLIGHRFQHCLPPKTPLCPDADYPKWKDAVTSFYRFQDEVIGRLVAQAPGRAIVVVSDHGFRSGEDRPVDYLPYTTGQPVEWHREFGIAILSGPGVKRGARLDKASVYDIAPTLLYLSGLPAGSDMPGRVLTEALDPAEVRGNPPRRIASYEEVGEARPSSSALAGADSSPEAQREMIESLQALGYVGPLPEPAARAAAAATASSPGGTTADGAGAASQSALVTYHRNMATYYMKSGRGAEAEAELLAANAIQPLPKTYEMLSEIRAGKGDIAGAVGFLEQGLRTFPEMDQEAVLWIVDLRISEGRADLAQQALSDWRGRLTRSALVDACEGKLAAARGDHGRAIELFLRALAQEPALSQAALAAAPLLHQQGRLPELQPFLEKALTNEQRIDEYQNLLGVILLEQGHPEPAMEAIGRALDVDPANARFLENYASAAFAARKAERALEHYRIALQVPGATGAVWSGYGRALGMGGRPADAVPAFEKARELGDRSPAMYLGFASALYQTGRKDRSREVAREGLKTYPDDPALQALNQRLG